MADQETVTLEITDEDGTTDELTVPTSLLGMLRQDDEGPAEIVGDIAMIGLAQRIHGAVHHSQGEPDQAVQDAEEITLELFEDRFGQSFGEMTGHDH